MLYATKTGKLMTDEDLNQLTPYQVERLGVYMVEDRWQEYN